MQIPVFPHLQERNVRTGFVEDHDYDKLAAACSKESLWMRALFEAGYQLGWRVSELLGLRVRQVDLLNRTIRLEPGETKNGKGRTAPIFDKLYPWIQQCVLGKDANDYVFTRDKQKTGPDGETYTENWWPVRDFRGTWYKVCSAAGLGKMVCRTCSTPIVSGKCTCQQERAPNEQVYEGLIFHDLRRTAIRNMVRAGIPEKVAMTISGRETRLIFDRYDIGSASDLEIARERMNARPEAKQQSTEIVPTQPQTAPSELQSLTQVQDDLLN